ncbi:MAG: monofunctional biosynthetic peptidoglycan transglycosylase [Rikenellaceae bacterium]|nr:monofunctional biosynthetic peptidoglycan transglycosylase [Rikenellaceae bacterium]
MKYFGRITLYFIIFFAVASVGCVAVFRYIPVTVTPFKAVQSLSAGRTGVDSKWVPLTSISPYLQKAVIATEDNNFLTHRGFDMDAIRTAMQERKEGRRKRGASTISQQTAKNVFCTPSGTWLRKGIESYFTVLIEFMWGKERIMEVYLNIIEVAPGVYGAESAAERFFGKPASGLNRNEAALIATVLPSPSRMNLAAPSSYMQRRSSQVVSLMNKLPDPDYSLVY